MTKRAVLYARAAAGSFPSTAQQIEACRQYSQRHGYEVTRDLVDELAARDPRPAFEELRDLVTQGEVDVVVCYTFDRLVRGPRDLSVVREEFSRRRTQLECVYWDRRVD